MSIELELNKIQKEDIQIKQHKLKTILDIEKLVSSAEDDSSVNKFEIKNYATDEKNSIVLDIISSLNIDEFDEYFTDTDGSQVRCSIESDIKYFTKNNTIVTDYIYSEFVSAIANYDIEDLVLYEVLGNYLKMIKEVNSCYDSMCLVDCKKI